MSGKATRGNTVAFGEYALQATECGWITARQIEAARVAMTRHVKRGGKIWIRIFPHKSVTKKPAETRMGKGKGAPEEWVAVIKPGVVLYEIEGVRKKSPKRRSCWRPTSCPSEPSFFQGRYLMKIKEIRDLSLDELRQKDRELVEELFKLRMRHASGQLDSPASLGNLRRDIARVRTVLVEKEVK